LNTSHVDFQGTGPDSGIGKAGGVFKAASVAFLPVTLGMTFTAARAANQPSEFSISNAVADPQLALLSMLFLGGMVLLFAGFGVSAVLVA
jgi:hypothetical protein